MESRDELKEIDIKNHMCHYLDDIMRVWDIDINFSDNILDEKLYKEKWGKYLNLGHFIQNFNGWKTISFRLDKIDGFIKIHDRIRYLILFNYGWFDKICDRIKYLISEKSGITDTTNHNFERIRTESYNSLPVEKILTFYVLTLTKSVVNRNKNEYYYILRERLV